MKEGNDSKWETIQQDERRKTFRWRDCTVNLRVLLGGNDWRTPIAEVISDKARIRPGPCGGKTLLTRFVDGCLLQQCKTIPEAMSALENWWSYWAAQNDTTTTPHRP